MPSQELRKKRLVPYVPHIVWFLTRMEFMRPGWSRRRFFMRDQRVMMPRLTVESVPLAEVIPYARNPRKNDAAVAKVAASIKEFGFRQPIVVDDEMVVIAGHTRLEAARQLGLAGIHRGAGNIGRDG